MRTMFIQKFSVLILAGLCNVSLLLGGAYAAPWDPAAGDYTGNKGKTIYVSKLGDNSDGGSWQKAFHTIQAALLAVPDDKGGHQIIIRPDTYVEANLYPSHRGAKGSYNLLMGDADGRLGSGATGWVVIDSSCPGVAVRTDTSGKEGNPGFTIIKSDLPESGLKCVDWWAPWRCDPKSSGVVWDRWIFRDLYATGAEGGMGWDMTSEHGAAFSVVVEDCVGIGRFAGGAVIAHTPRKDEPVLFRRCYFVNLDWWGDSGGVYVRGENKSMPDCPDAVFDDCTIIGPNNALKIGWAGVGEHCTRVRMSNCRLMVLNFSQPRGCPSSGIVRCELNDAKQCHVDFEDCTLMGYKAFGTRKGEISYTLKGVNKAYVEYEQAMPKGFERLGLWPVELFERLAVPQPKGAKSVVTKQTPKYPPLSYDPSTPSYNGRQGVALYVSKNGDNSDGRSWRTAFRTIQAALSAVPDDKGGHRIIIRPDTYVEANLRSWHCGAKGAYNLMIGDADGRLGSGATGWVVIDSSCPGVAVRNNGEQGGNGDWMIVKSDLPESGFKSVDYWSPWHCRPGSVSDGWDRWVFRNLYGTGGEAGFGGEVPEGKPCSIVWENCCGVGRFAGGTWIGHATRENEPVLYRHCYFLNVDWWGDCGGVYIRGASRRMPERPDATFEDCTIVGLDNAMQAGWSGVDALCTRVCFRDCRLMVLNFSQPRGTPSTGIINSGLKDGKRLHIDFENTAVMGYKVFGTRKGDVSYTMKGKNTAYVQFEQTVPQGFERLGLWPVDLYNRIVPPQPIVVNQKSQQF